MIRWSTLAPMVTFAAIESCRDPPAAPATTTTPSIAASDGMVELEGASMHFHCYGSGSPTVVFDAAIGLDGTAWRNVAPSVAGLTRACVYDRKGTGYSSAPVVLPHTNRQMADELYELLARAGVRGPYVLVGHSVGGINMRLLASTHLSEIAGMVLVDSADDPMRLWSLMPPDAVSKRREELKNGPEGLDLDAFVAGVREMHDTSKSIGDKPLVVVTRGLADAPPGASPAVAREWLRVWQEQQLELLGLSTNVVQVTARNSHHMIPVEAPSLVVASVEEVVQAVRTHGRVRESVLTAFANEGPKAE
jgi:pimeloyl-ACP methyl ester carboxylesterase